MIPGPAFSWESQARTVLLGKHPAFTHTNPSKFLADAHALGFNGGDSLPHTGLAPGHRNHP
jgi:hypothetical protein